MSHGYKILVLLSAAVIAYFIRLQMIPYHSIIIPYLEFDISRHPLAQHENSDLKKIVLIGGSQISNEGLMFDSTENYLQPYVEQKAVVYNFGIFGVSNIVAEFYLYLQATQHRPDLIMIGLNHYDFFLNIANYRDYFLEDMMQTISPYINEFEKSLIHTAIERRTRSERSDFVTDLQVPRLSPAIKKVFSGVYELKTLLYGPEYRIDVTQLNETRLTLNFNLLRFLKKIKEHSAKNGIQTVFFLTPTLESKNLKFYREYKKQVLDFAAKNEIPIDDFSELLPSSPEYFHDLIHRTPKGNKIFAETMNKYYLQKFITSEGG